MKLIDSHCHLDFDPLRQNISEFIRRAKKAGVEKIINVGASLSSSRSSVELTCEYPNVWASVGLHPHEAETIFDLESKLESLEELALNEKVIAIGEIGLDFFDPSGNGQVSTEIKKKQSKLFVCQLNLAKKIKKPIIVHVREAWDDAYEILQDFVIQNQGQVNCPGVLHCFTGGPEEAKKFLALGFYIGLTGFVTFNQSKFDPVRKAVKIIPLDKILIETDAPFLAPEPFRGKVNEPSFLINIAQRVAEIKNVSLLELVKNTTQNTEKLFNIN